MPRAPSVAPVVVPSVAPKDEGSGLELDISDYRPPSSIHPSAMPRPSKVPAVAGAPPIPSFTEEAVLEFEPEVLEEVARFGPPPSNLFVSVSYALRTRKRSGELRRKAAGLEAGVAHSKSELVGELARLGERARVGGYHSKVVSPLLAAVDAADRSAESAKDAIAAERRRHEQRALEIEQRLEELRVRIEEPRLKESKLSSQLAEVEEKRRQIEMRLKRVEIEIRNAEDLIARSQQPTSGAANAGSHEALAQKAREAEAALPGNQAERQRLRSENAVLDDPITDLRTQLTASREEVDKLKAARIEAVKSRDEEESLHASNMDQISSRSQQAKEEAQLKLAEIGRAVRFDRNAPVWAQELFPTVDQRAVTYLHLWEDHQKLLFAADAYDHGAVQRGFIVLFGGAGLAVTALIALIVILTSLT